MRASWRSRRPIFGPLTRSTSSRTVCARCSARTWKPPSAGARPPERVTLDTVRVTIGFVDLVGYSRLTQQLDVRALGTLVERFEALASDIVAARDGRVVKLIGDAVMFVAVDAGAACDIALTLLERFADDPSVTPRGGLASGTVLLRGGDYYGPAVNLASRIAELAVPREILVTAEVAERAGTG